MEMNIPAQTVFVIDDDAAVRRATSRLIRSAGWAVETFATATEFLGRLPVSGTGCILLDVKMPGIQGPDLLDRLLEADQGLPVVFLTGHGDVPTSVRAMKNGAVDFLLKPVDADILIDTIGTALRRHAVEQDSRHLRDSVRERYARLSVRECEVLAQVLRGRLNKQIAFDLGIAEKTVKFHRGRVMEKMEAASLAELVHLCDGAGIGPPPGRLLPALEAPLPETPEQVIAKP
jgi:FixJ family two-component response regulator